MSFSLIDAVALKNNFDTIKKRCAPAATYCVVKSDAYGCGAVETSKRLQRFGADGFVVTKADEGVLLRKNGISKPIVVLGRTPLNKAGLLTKYSLTQSVFCEEYFNTLAATSARPPVWLKINCGFNRLGFGLDKVLGALKKIKNEGFDVKGVFAHLSASAPRTKLQKEINKTQIAAFDAAVAEIKAAGFKNLSFCLCNSGGAATMQNKYDAVRIGAGLYGIGDTNALAIKSVYATILQVNKLKIGETLGYDAGFIARKECRIAVLDIGYADGLFRCLSGKGRVYLNGEYCKIIGNICMNHCFVLLKDGMRADVGDNAEVAGKFVTAKQIAKRAATIDYEVYCRLNGEKTIYLD